MEDGKGQRGKKKKTFQGYFFLPLSPPLVLAGFYVQQSVPWLFFVRPQGRRHTQKQIFHLRKEGEGIFRPDSIFGDNLGRHAHPKTHAREEKIAGSLPGVLRGGRGRTTSAVAGVKGYRYRDLAPPPPFKSTLLKPDIPIFPKLQPGKEEEEEEETDFVVVNGEPET